MKKVSKTISKFFLFNAIHFNAVDSEPYYQSMIDTIAEASRHQGSHWIPNWKYIFGRGGARA